MSAFGVGMGVVGLVLVYLPVYHEAVAVFAQVAAVIARATGGG